MALFKIGQCSYYIIYIISMMIFWVVRGILLYYKNNFYGDIKSPLFFSFLSSMGYVLGGFLELISRSLSQNKILGKSSIVFNAFASEKLLKRKNKKKRTEQTFVWQFIIVIPLGITLTINYTLYILVDNYSQKKIINKIKVGQVLFDVILSKIFLRYSIFKHQVLAIVFMIIGIIMILWDSFSSYWIECIYCFFYYIFYALPDVLIKLITNKKTFSIFMLMFVEGIIMIIIYIPCMIIAMFIPCNESTFFTCNENNVVEDVIFTIKDYYGANPLQSVLFTLGYILVQLGYITFLKLTIYYFTPNHRGMSDSFSAILLWLFMLSIQNQNEINALSIQLGIGYLLIAISTLIYNEFIILKVCSLEENTKEEIEKRCIEEKTLELETNIINISVNNDTTDY